MITTRACATCGQAFTVNPRTPRRRYCTPRCRAEDWRRRHNPSHAPTSSNAANAADGAWLADNVTNVANPVPPANDVANDDRRASLARCPHCQTPIAVLTLLVPPAAAHVAPPQAHHG
ncbi:MAG TPA: hypothetical protein VF468_04785 [Actinomycetota bacterium]|nr:hypothetical protein [Actinomycetota bacterium]